MTLNPKLTIVSGVALTSGGFFAIYRATKETDKKKKLIYGAVGAGLILSGIYAGYKGVIQVMSHDAQKKAADEASTPAKGIIADMKAEVKNNPPQKKNPTPSQNFSGEKNNDSFDLIMKSASDSHIANTISEPKKPAFATPKNNGIGIKVVGTVDVNKIRENAIKKQEIQKEIDAKDVQHKSLIKKKGMFNSDLAKQLRYDMAILKGKLFHV